ncbi:hypothetical protein [Streptomyces sp. Agncl-13]|uniref:hypothetical protein n=1 Tax=Streptomyces sp. Agncl-13 TaxID=3400628 RepID=UPI003A8B8158
MSGRGRGLEVAALVVGLLGVVVVVAFGSVAHGWESYGRDSYESSTISSRSMSPTYEPGDLIIFERVGDHGGAG